MSNEDYVVSWWELFWRVTGIQSENVGNYLSQFDQCNPQTQRQQRADVSEAPNPQVMLG